MNDENFITIQGWMRTKLKLKGNDLLVYAIIYSFSQTDNQKFTGSLQYLADWCGASKQGIQKNLKNLIDLGYVEKDESTIQPSYRALYNSVVQPYNSVVHPIQLSCTNNIDNTKDNTKDNIKNNNTNVVPTESDFSFGKPRKKKKSLYEKCNDSIYEFVYTNDDLSPDEKVRLVSILKIYLDFILEYDKSVSKTLYFNVWRSMLNKLKQVKNDTEDSYYDIVNYALSKSWKNFYPIPKNISSFDKPKDVADMRKEPSIKNKVDKRLEVKNRSGDTY